MVQPPKNVSPAILQQWKALRVRHDTESARFMRCVEIEKTKLLAKHAVEEQEFWSKQPNSGAHTAAPKRTQQPDKAPASRPAASKSCQQTVQSKVTLSKALHVKPTPVRTTHVKSRAWTTKKKEPEYISLISDEDESAPPKKTPLEKSIETSNRPINLDPEQRSDSTFSIPSGSLKLFGNASKKHQATSQPLDAEQEDQNDSLQTQHSFQSSRTQTLTPDFSGLPSNNKALVTPHISLKKKKKPLLPDTRPELQDHVLRQQQLDRSAILKKPTTISRDHSRLFLEQQKSNGGLVGNILRNERSQSLSRGLCSVFQQQDVQMEDGPQVTASPPGFAKGELLLETSQAHLLSPPPSVSEPRTPGTAPGFKKLPLPSTGSFEPRHVRARASESQSSTISLGQPRSSLADLNRRRSEREASISTRTSSNKKRKEIDLSGNDDDNEESDYVPSDPESPCTGRSGPANVAKKPRMTPSTVTRSKVPPPSASGRKGFGFSSILPKSTPPSTPTDNPAPLTPTTPRRAKLQAEARIHAQSEEFAATLTTRSIEEAAAKEARLKATTTTQPRNQNIHAQLRSMSLTPLPTPPYPSPPAPPSTSPSSKDREAEIHTTQAWTQARMNGDRYLFHSRKHTDSLSSSTALSTTRRHPSRSKAAEEEEKEEEEEGDPELDISEYFYANGAILHKSDFGTELMGRE